MPKENLETKARKAVLKIEKKVTDIYSLLSDVSLKLCHLIKKNGYYGLSERNNYYK